MLYLAVGASLFPLFDQAIQFNALDHTEVALSRVEVGKEEEIRPSGRLHLGDVDIIPCKRRHEHLVIDHELSGLVGVLLNLPADLSRLVEVPPVEVEREEHVHLIVGSGLLGEVELGVRGRIDVDVQSKGVDAEPCLRCPGSMLAAPVASPLHRWHHRLVV